MGSGVFCDITGTLVYTGPSSEIQINWDVVAFLRYMRDTWAKPITLCSRIQDNGITPHSLREEFGFVVEKAILKSRVLEVLVDNNPDPFLNTTLLIDPEHLTGFHGLHDGGRHSKLSALAGCDFNG